MAFKEQNKYFFIVVLLFVALMFVALCISNVQKIEDCRISHSEYSKYCITDIAVSTKEPSICEILSNQSVSDVNFCILNYAAENIEPKICERIKQVDSPIEDIWQNISPEDCQNNVVLREALNKRNVEICDKLTDYNKKTADHCIEEVAYLVLDASLCKKIQDVSERGFCTGTIVCAKLEDKGINFDEAVNICNDLTEEEGKSFCLQNIVNKAHETGYIFDSKKCDILPDSNSKEICYQFIPTNAKS